VTSLVIRAFLYDVADHDREIDATTGTLPALADHQLLWLDVTGRDIGDLSRVAELLVLKPQVAHDMTQSGRTFTLVNYGDYVHFDVAALHHDRTVTGSPKPSRSTRLDLAIGPTWLLTVHEQPLPFLESFREQDRGETLIGALTPAALAASLLDWHLAVYLAALEDVEVFADRVDVRMLSSKTIREDLLKELVTARRHVSSLRRSLAPQNAIFYGLSRPDIAQITGADAKAFGHLEHRFERVLDTIEHGRDLIQSSFDLFTTRTAETTNTLIRRLTFLSIMLGVLAGISGVFGMNFDTPYPKTGLAGFWAVIIAFAVIVAASALVGRARRWF
jgi:magnesium transporter